jgi:hypothetical protein
MPTWVIARVIRDSKGEVKGSSSMPRPGTCSREDPRFRVSLQGRGEPEREPWMGEECLTCNGSPPDLLSWSCTGVNAPIHYSLSYCHTYCLPVCLSRLTPFTLSLALITTYSLFVPFVSSAAL